MFLEKQPKEQQEYYKRLLSAIGSLSNLFSEAPEPYLVSRVTENLFCKSFDADNLSRSDVSADASKDKIGLGIKTFINGNGKTMQKVAEFNGDHFLFNNLSTEEKIKKIVELRNERIEITKRIFGLDDLIYHCITRSVGKILIYETPCPLIDMGNISDIKLSSRGSTIQFKDGDNEYSFNNSKSTLYKRFITKDVILEVPVKILKDPFSTVEKLIKEEGLIFAPIKTQPHIFLPLYSVRGGVKSVQPRSGLNQWNAKPRFNRSKGTYTPRNLNELYIPIPAWIHRKFPNFFPARDKAFELMLPDRKSVVASICQDGGKALMSNPNEELGKWLLRDVMNIPNGELLTYEKLEKIGLDTVVVYKIDHEHYDIDFTSIGSYERFKEENDESVDDQEYIEEQDEE